MSDTCVGTTAHVATLACGLAPAGVRIWLDHPTDVVFQLVTIPIGTTTGWHHHPGPLLVAVVSGTLSWVGADGRHRTYDPGVAFVEEHGPAAVHSATNLGAEPAVLAVAYLVPSDAPLSCAD